jgi:FtsZ-binding cell division protein ZapB
MAENNEAKNLENGINKSKEMYKEAIESLKRANAENKLLWDNVRHQDSLDRDYVLEQIKAWYKTQASIAEEYQKVFTDGLKETYNALPSLKDINIREELEKTTERLREEAKKMYERVGDLFGSKKEE